MVFAYCTELQQLIHTLQAPPKDDGLGFGYEAAIKIACTAMLMQKLDELGDEIKDFNDSYLKNPKHKTT